MSMHISVVSIEGNHLAEVGEVLQTCKYVIENTFTVKTGVKASSELGWHPDRTRVAKIAYFADGWTFIVDPELVLATDDVWLDYSKKWKTRVLGWLCEGASGTFGLTMFASGKQRREVFSVAGEIPVNEGKPLAEEGEIDWSEASEEDVLAIAERFGAEFDFTANREYVVFRLDESQIASESD